MSNEQYEAMHNHRSPLKSSLTHINTKTFNKPTNPLVKAYSTHINANVHVHEVYP